MPKIIDHGTWVVYVPELDKRPKDAPATAMFARRESDGMDWYTYVHSGKNFQPDTVKLTIDMKRDGKAVVRSPMVEADRMFPGNCRLIEIEGVTRRQDEASLIDEFCNKEIDLVSGQVGKLWEDPDLPKIPNMQLLLENIATRLGNLERKVNGQSSTSTAAKPKGRKGSTSTDR
jgi:hypothetical protein